MDKSWINESDLYSVRYLQGVASFLEYALKSSRNSELFCPCRKCVNLVEHNKDTVAEHLLKHGFCPSYVEWCYHGEALTEANMYCYGPPSRQSENVRGADTEYHVADFMEDMFVGHNQFQDTVSTKKRSRVDNLEVNEDALKFYGFLKETDKELFNGCQKHSRLSFVLDLFHKKCMYKWSNKSFTELLSTLRETLPEGDKLPKSSYEVKKFINQLGLGYEKIHACPNNCMLFWKEKEDLNNCSFCGASRWVTEPNKNKKKAAKILRWFPLKPRLQRLFMCSKTASLMRWHDAEREKDGKLRHPADAIAWKKFDNQFVDFAADPRNVRLGLASDGFNPYRTLSSTYSIWPVILTVYNFPPYMCMKQPSLILSLLIPGKESPGEKIDVYLRPLIDELKDLWDKGLDTYDAHVKTCFKMHATLLWTINDFPGYGALSGWNVRSRYACPSCGYKTWYKWLKNGGKYCYMGHRRFLPLDHRFRRDKRHFDGTVEFREAPTAVTGVTAVAQMDGDIELIDIEGEVAERTHGWKRKSILYELPYWKYNLLRHNLDVMHIEKNVCDNILGTLLNLEGKTKDNYKARLDLEEMGIRPDLHPVREPGKKLCLPPATYSMNKSEVDKALAVMKNIKVPDGYSSNISRCVKLKERKILGLKSHDTHVLMQELLPLAIRGSLPKKVVKCLVALCSYFKDLCSNVLDPTRVDEMEAKIGIILCQLEMIFPPSFFTIMVHLVVHLATEAKLGGPVPYRWMYPIERDLLTLKQYVGNRAAPEGSIAEGYIADESMSYCSRYFEGVETRFNRPSRNEDYQEDLIVPDAPLYILNGRPFLKVESITLDDRTLLQAHRYILYNSECVRPFIEEHKDVIRRLQDYRKRKTPISNAEVEVVHHSTFTGWFQRQVSRFSEMNNSRVTEQIRWLAQGPSDVARRFKGYIIRGTRYRIKAVDDRKKTQNKGVVVMAETSISENALTYYGIINDMIELNYYERFRVVLFKCDWVDVEKGSAMKKDEFGSIIVNFSSLIHTGEREIDEPFVLASQVKPVFYVADPLNEGWHVVVHTQPRDTYDMGNQTRFDLNITEYLGTDNEDGVWARDDMAGETVTFDDIDQQYSTEEE